MSSIESIGKGAPTTQAPTATPHSESSAKAAEPKAEAPKPQPPPKDAQNFSAYSTIQGASDSTVKGVNVEI